jgi:hypothetical protein
LEAERDPTCPESTRPWAAEVRLFLRNAMRDRAVSYAELSRRLAAIGVDYTDVNLRNKLHRGTFSAVFLLQCLTALGVEQVTIGDLAPRRGRRPRTSAGSPGADP